MSQSWLPSSLLTLFTSPERAESIQGDLTEEARTRGRLWFWSQVLRTAVALLWKGFPRSPFEAIGLTACGIAAWFGTGVAMVTVVDSIEAALQAQGVSIAIRAAPVMLFGMLLSAIVLVRLAPVRGIYAVVGSTIATVPFVTFVGLFNFNARPPDDPADFAIQIAVGLTAGLLLLATALFRRRVRRPAGRIS